MKLLLINQHQRRLSAVLRIHKIVLHVSFWLLLGSKSLMEEMSAPIDFHLEGIGSINHVVKRKTNVRLLIGEKGGESVVNVECLVVKRITGDHPNFKINKEIVSIPNSIKLADPDWNKCQPIDILIGGQYFWNFVKDNTKTLGPNAPILKDSVFGWLLVGPLSQEPSTSSGFHAQCNLSTLASLDASLRMFWEIEEIPQAKNSVDEHNEVEQLYRSSTSRNENGRYVVRLPLNDRIGELGNNRASATYQFLSLERRLGKKEDLKIAYSQAIKEYLDLKIIEEVPSTELDSPSYYLPHHGVVREQAISTKLRIVFNASARSQSGVSLNQCLMVGPVVQPSLVEVLWRFRLHKYALTCDIVKMYLQVHLVPEHRNYQRFIWREHPSDDIKHYRFRTVCFGIASSPYLATRTLNQLADDEGQSFPMAAKAVKESFYVDDCLASVPEQAQVLELKHQLIHLMERGQFQLAKFQTNCSVEVDNNQESHSDVIISDNVVKTLGLMWNSKVDTFQFKLSNDLPKKNVTKRQILSVIARIYDPLGMLGPIVTNAKLILQAAWQCKTDWDMIVPGELQHRWASFINDLPSIELLRIPRWVVNVESPAQVELHVFSDASSLAYGAAIFLVCEDVNGHRSSGLLTAKSKITPLKSTEAQGNELTIPKAELLGAQMAAELMFMVSKALGIERKFYWTDAAVVLHQIYSPSEKRETFVRNKVRIIRKLSQAEEWGHVPTKQNPADALSRGSTVQELMINNLWWLGPDWLTKGTDSWPVAFSPHTFSITRDTSLASVNVVLKEEKSDHPQNSVYAFLISRISLFRKMQRVLAWCLRAITIFKTRKGRTTRSMAHGNTLSGPLTAEELLRAETLIIKWEQHDHLLPIITAVKKGNLNQQPKFKFVRRLRPFLDDDGLLRVGGRLHNSAEPYDTQHPKILPKGKLANLLALQFHLNLLHGGPTILLSSLRQRYWPLGGRSLARQTVHNCVPCFKAKPQFQTQIMADLPEHRVNNLRPFFATGMDFAGPLLLRSGSRKAPPSKAYIIVMVCMSTKATHLDLVSSLATDAFIASLRRFTARRGIPSFIYSDNGTTFVGADSELKKMLQSMSFNEEIGNFMASLEIKWRFQPPRAPHHGGLWEATVKSCKYHLKRVLGLTPLTFEEMSIILCQIEAVLNSRPLFQLPSVSDVKDPSCLTPGHFLVGSALTQLPDPNLGHLLINRLDRWQLCQRLQQNFTDQWKRDYLHTLQTRVKWSKEFPNIKVGDVVLHLDEQTPSTSWPLGLISSVFPGKDGKIRVVDVTTAKGKFRRPITKIVKLPTNDELEKNWPLSGEDVRAQNSDTAL
ncbi:uncharacterized protein LOC129809234 [Phlebotomus papatasi]|uniref:uncharacterized protein LOC129809234 n=1 Tax=Phlebotomus papatasi TaxID=29031 RepID=UPI00248403E9|nr:uncharacterized protein LOC129809234 [Phlebotomus papatasi]